MNQTNSNQTNTNKLIEQFGANPIDSEIIKRLNKIYLEKNLDNNPIAKLVHSWFKRGIICSHKDFDIVLNKYENKEPIYIYTGRGPSSISMHLGHLIPFYLCFYLQKLFGAFVIIQLSDDEKFYFKSDPDQTIKSNQITAYNDFAYANASDIIACGFDPNLTYMFSNYRSFNSGLYQNVVKINRSITLSQIQAIYGLTESDNMGRVSWSIYQCAPAFSNSFIDIFHSDSSITNNADIFDISRPDNSIEYNGKHIQCLVPMALDQDPYFRMARDFAKKYQSQSYLKPALIHTTFLPSLTGIDHKMSSTDMKKSSVIYLDEDPNKIIKKINKYAFSGGGDTLELHRTNGANLDVDISYQYLRFFIINDDDLDTYANFYRSGFLTTGEIKNIAGMTIAQILIKHQKIKADLTIDYIRSFFQTKHFNISNPDITDLSRTDLSKTDLSKTDPDN